MRPGEVIADRFELDKLMRRGGMGAIWRAKDRMTGDLVAFKVLQLSDPEQEDRFAREARVLAELTHPAIVRYVAHGKLVDDAPWLAMEWLDGQDLRVRLSKQTLTMAESVELVRRVADAIGVAHARGVIHRDLKPSNLFFTSADVASVKVL